MFRCLTVQTKVDAPIAFQTSSPPPDVVRSVLAWYPDDAKDILVSGYAQGAEKLAQRDLLGRHAVELVGPQNSHPRAAQNVRTFAGTVTVLEIFSFGFRT